MSDARTFIIAEAGVNHNGDEKMALSMDSTVTPLEAKAILELQYRGERCCYSVKISSSVARKKSHDIINF
jgi:sialic acid synthase SpsE